MNSFRKLIREILEEYHEQQQSATQDVAEDEGIMVYHRGNSNNIGRDLETASSVAPFGDAMYFSDNNNIKANSGDFFCTYSIKLAEPSLNMNEEISEELAQNLLQRYNEMFNSNLVFDFTGDIQVGEFFETLDELTDYQINLNMKNFIQSFGIKSFYYFQDSNSYFQDRKGLYGISYGIYDPADVKFISC